ncbi:hypothetical protein Fmac_028747 [Flemingia macrophylla]|uniref:Uncharacterized protein n=1 Tax=Flemingia macrophylla TaxID=520843 RepID=A0ABD1L8Q6_9FABA
MEPSGVYWEASALDTILEMREFWALLKYQAETRVYMDEHPQAYAANTYSRPPQQGVHDVATDTFAETRKLEGKLDALVNLVTQLAADQKLASFARVCGISSSNDHHTSVCPSSQQSGVDEHPEAYAANNYSRPPQQGVHDVATDTSAETRKLEGKLDALVNLVTQLALRIRSLPLLQESAASVLPMTTILVSVLLRNNLEWMTILRLIYIFETRKLEDKLDAIVNLVTQLAANQKPTTVARVCGVRSSNDHHTNISAETRKLEGKLDAIVNLVTQLAANKKPASVVIAFGIRSSNDHHTNACPSSQQFGFSARNDTIVIRGVHDVATDTSAKTRKLEGKLDALVNLVTQLAANQKPASIARVCDIRSSNDHHTSACHSSQQSGLFSARKDVILIRGVHDVATDTAVETRKLEGKRDASVNLVTQLAVNQKPASVARVCGISSSNDHHTSVCPSSQQSGVDDHPEAYLFSARNDVIVSRGAHDVAIDTSVETRKLEGKLDAIVNLVTQLASNQKPASIAKFSARNDAIIIRGVHNVATDTSVETIMLERKLDALVNLVTQLAANQEPNSVARVGGIHSNDHHTRVCHSTQQSGMDEHPEAYAANTYSRPPQQGVHDVATDTSAETKKLEGKLDAIMNLVIQLAVNQKLASVAKVCGNRSSNDHHTNLQNSKDKALDREDGSRLLAVKCKK